MNRISGCGMQTSYSEAPVGRRGNRLAHARYARKAVRSRARRCYVESRSCACRSQTFGSQFQQDIAGNAAISTNFASEIARLDIEKIQRKQLSDLAAKGLSPDADYAPDSDQARIRSGIIANSGADAAAVARKNAADLLSIQEQAAIQSADLIKDSNLKSFNSLKDQVTSILDSVESHSKNIFQAIGDTLKKSLLGALNDVISSQVARGLFSVFNPVKVSPDSMSSRASNGRASVDYFVNSAEAAHSRSSPAVHRGFRPLRAVLRRVMSATVTVRRTSFRTLALSAHRIGRNPAWRASTTRFRSLRCRRAHTGLTSLATVRRPQ